MSENMVDAKQIYNIVDKRVGLSKIRFLLKERVIPSQKQGNRLVAKQEDVMSYFRSYYVSDTREHNYAN